MNSASHTVPDEGSRKGPAAIQHEGKDWIKTQEKKNYKRTEDDANLGFRVKVQKSIFSEVGVRMRSCSPEVLGFYLFFPQCCAVHYMQLEECRRGAAKRERVFMSAHKRREKNAPFF